MPVNRARLQALARKPRHPASKSGLRPARRSEEGWLPPNYQSSLTCKRQHQADWNCILAIASRTQDDKLAVRSAVAIPSLQRLALTEAWLRLQGQSHWTAMGSKDSPALASSPYWEVGKGEFQSAVFAGLQARKSSACASSQEAWACTRGGTRIRNLLLRREAHYPLGHTSCWAWIDDQARECIKTSKHR